jgi:hypothetical protein
MNRKIGAPRASLLVSMFWLAAAGLAAAQTAPEAPGDPADNPGPVRVVRETKRDLSMPWREMPFAAPRPKPQGELETELMRWPKGTRETEEDGALQSWLPDAPAAMPGALLQFDGIDAASSLCGCAPPDTNAEVGSHHVVQMVNTALQVFDKSGTSLFGPVAINSVWSGFGGACQNENFGDPVVVYDQLADRWVISQFTDDTPPFFECIAVSQTGDPTGAWYRYAFQTSTTKFNDYPKLGVWPDGYYMTANLFTSVWAGAGVYAFDRAAMLTGAPATMQLFELPPSDWGGMLPSDLDGSTPPPAGAANVFVEVLDDQWDPGTWPNDELHFHKFHVDWAIPANTTFNATPIQVAVATFDGMLCGFGACVPQTGTTQKLDTLSDRLMFRLAYRNFGTHESLVLNHAVDAGTNQAAIRWYEIRDPRANPPTIFQQSTFAPDSVQRWMASAAMDSGGNLAIAYNASSSGLSPSIRYAGRLAGDPAGTLPQGEATLLTSAASQTGGSRWGDYSDLTVDPTDDCTFWMALEYATGNMFNWRTRIGAFRFPDCGTLFRDNFETGGPGFWTAVVQ